MDGNEFTPRESSCANFNEMGQFLHVVITGIMFVEPIVDQIDRKNTDESRNVNE